MFNRIKRACCVKNSQFVQSVKFFFFFWLTAAIWMNAWSIPIVISLLPSIEREPVITGCNAAPVRSSRRLDTHLFFEYRWVNAFIFAVRLNHKINLTAKFFRSTVVYTICTSCIALKRKLFFWQERQFTHIVFSFSVQLHIRTMPLLMYKLLTGQAVPEYHWDPNRLIIIHLCRNIFSHQVLHCKEIVNN